MVNVSTGLASSSDLSVALCTSWAGSCWVPHWPVYFEDLELWLPEQMDEIYETRWPRGEAHAAPGSALLPRGNEYITCKARYTNYRRFEVETQEEYDLPE